MLQQRNIFKADRYTWVTFLILADSLLSQFYVYCFLAYSLWEIRSTYYKQFDDDSADALNSDQTMMTEGQPSFALCWHFASLGALVTRIFMNWILFDGLWICEVARSRAGLFGSYVTAAALLVSGLSFWLSQGDGLSTFSTLVNVVEMSFPFYIIVSIVAFCVMRKYQPILGDDQECRKTSLSPAHAIMLAFALCLIVFHAWHLIIENLSSPNMTATVKIKFLHNRGICDC